MKRIKTAAGLEVSQIALGCMRISGKSAEEVEALVRKALELGINYFDHADIYGSWNNSYSEAIFGTVLQNHPELREQMIIQSKCSIRQGMYDCSKDYILKTVDEILGRLHTDYLDVLLIHRPDALMDPEEVADAFNILEQSGKVRYFGVSNMNSLQIELLQKYCSQKLLFDQLQFSLAHTGLIDAGMYVNMKCPQSIDHDGDVLTYCRIHDITVQAWSILQIDLSSGSFLNHPDYPELNEKINALAKKYNVVPAAIAAAWILRHPAKIQAIAGTTSPQHLEELAMASRIDLTREEWYSLYLRDKVLP